MFDAFKDELILDNQLRDFVTITDAKEEGLTDDSDEDNEDGDDIEYEIAANDWLIFVQNIFRWLQIT